MKGFDTSNGAKNHKSDNSGVNEIDGYLVDTLGAFDTRNSKRCKTMSLAIVQRVV